MTAQTWVVYDGPYDNESPVIGCQVALLKEEAIRAQKRSAQKRGRTYASDEAALDDFMVIHWARLEERKIK
jgi:hypothetical protein